MAYLLIALRAALVVVFLASSVSKVRNRSAFDEFTANIHDMRLLPTRFSRVVSVLIVSGELLICLLLTTLPSAKVFLGFAVAAMLLAVFTAGIIWMMRRETRVPCRCFGASTTPVGVPHITRNSAMGIIALIGMLPALGQGASQVPGSLIAVMFGCLVGGVLVFLEDIFEVFTPIT